MLEVLDRRNLFVIPLDARREWYRYHHLFADVLRARLVREEPDRVLDLHRRASRWFEQRGESHDAIRHALAGEDFERAAGMIEMAIPGLRQARQEATMRRWFELLPDRVVSGSAGPERGVCRNAHGARRVSRTSRCCCKAQSDGWDQHPTIGSGQPVRPAAMVVVDEAEFRRLPSAVALYRAAQAQIEGDRERTEAFAQQAFDLAGDDDPLGRGAAAGFLALAHLGERRPRGRPWLLDGGHGLACNVPATPSMRSVATDRWRRSAPPKVVCTRRCGPTNTACGWRPTATTVLRGAGDMHVGMS